MAIMVYPEGCDPSDPSYWFYDHTVELKFNKAKWAYYLVLPDGGRELQAGVTHTCHVIDKSAPLMAWAVKKALEKARRLFIERGYIAEDAAHADALSILYITTLDEILAEAKKADSEELEAAGETGHDAHGWIEKYIRAVLEDNENRRLELLAKFPLDERATNCCLAALEWMDKHNVRWIATERKIYSRKHKYAGTMDGLAIVDSCDSPDCCPHHFKDRLTVVDWKTSNHLYIEYLLQTAAYQQAHQEETGKTIEDRWIIRLGKDDAEFDPWHMEGQEKFQEDLDTFLAALLLCIQVDKLDDRIAAIKNERTERRKVAERAVRDGLNKLKCPDSDDYKGVRKKKCNGGDGPCVACAIKYAEKHSVEEKKQ